MTGDVVALEDIHVRYELRGSTFTRKRDYLNALNGITMTVRKGETLAVVGESGSGKSTLAMAILGLLRQWKGRIVYRFRDADLMSWEGRPLRRRELLDIWSRSSIVFQDPYSSLDSKKLVKDIIVEAYLGHRKGSRKEAERIAKQLIEQVGLSEDHLGYYPDQLSGGQRQRIAVARTLINEPELIIFDEPTSSLDVSIQAQMLNLILDMKEKHDLTYLFITHNLVVAKHVSDRIMVLYLGNVMEVGYTDNVFGSPLHPYTKLLISSVPLPSADYVMKQRETRETEVSSIVLPKGCVFHPRCPVATDYCGWKADEIVQLVKREAYLLLGLEEVSAEINDDLNFTLKLSNEKDAGRLLGTMRKNGRFRTMSVERHGSSIVCRLHDSWIPHLVRAGGREVNCILYDEPFMSRHGLKRQSDEN